MFDDNNEDEIKNVRELIKTLEGMIDVIQKRQAGIPIKATEIGIVKVAEELNRARDVVIAIKYAEYDQNNDVIKEMASILEVGMGVLVTMMAENVKKHPVKIQMDKATKDLVAENFPQYYDFVETLPEI